MRLDWFAPIALAAVAAAQPLPQYVIYRTASPIVIDARLDEPAWQQAPSTGQWNFHWWKEGPKEQTVAKMLWDDENLYVSYYCHDRHISAYVTQRHGPVSKDDCVEIFISPNPEKWTNYYTFEINAIGTMLNRCRTSWWTGPPNWEPEGVRYRASYHGQPKKDETPSDDHWIVEMAVPFRNFARDAAHTPPRDGDQWRLNLNRIGGLTNPQRSSWSPIAPPSLTFHTPAAFGFVRYVNQPPPQVQEPRWLDLDKTEPAGTKYRSFPSRAASGEVSYLVYLPQEYDKSGAKRYPVVYWLHGLGGNQRAGAPFVAQLNAAIGAGKAPAMIAVLVNGLRDSRYVDSRDGRRPVETVIIQDLIPHVDATYRTLARRESRGIEGFSMGGFGAARLGFQYPDLFGAVSIMAGALLDTQMVASRAELFEKNFGSDKLYFWPRSPWVLAHQNADRIRGRTAVRVAVGAADPLYERNLTYHEMLERLKIKNEFAALPGVGHNQRLFYEKRGADGFAFYQKAFAR